MMMYVWLIDHVNAAAASKLDAAAAKNDSKRTRVSIPKLTDAIWAGGPKASACSLILCEGDSAKTMAISGLSTDDRKTFGVFREARATLESTSIESM